MTRAHGLVSLQLAMSPVSLQSISVSENEYVKVQLRVVKVPIAAPGRSAGYDTSLGCPGASPLSPGAPAIGRNSVT